MQNTERKLIAAVNTIVEEEGFPGLGINKVARIAGCNKTFIYRRFKSLEGLVLAWARENDFFTTSHASLIGELASIEKPDIKGHIKEVFASLSGYLGENEMMRRMLAWELSGDGRFKEIRLLRERCIREAYALVNDRLEGEIPGLGMRLSFAMAAIYYTALQSPACPGANGGGHSGCTSVERLRNPVDEYLEFVFEGIKNE